MLSRWLSVLITGVGLLAVGACSSASRSPAPSTSATQATKVSAHELYWDAPFSGASRRVSVSGCLAS